MKIQKTLRDVQDRMRNAGWRIQWIPWQEPDKPEVINSKNPLALIGAVIFVTSLFLGGQRLGSIIITEKEIIIIAVAGLTITMLGIIMSAFQRQAGWKRVDAQCIDREIGECMGDPDDMTSTWAYRPVCVFTYEGREYKVTPEPSPLTSFNSEQQVQKYSRERIQPDGHCRLWINPQNPLQTIFHKKRWWL
jgi:hypothetical protein